MKKLLAGFALLASVVPTSFTFAAAPATVSVETRVATCTERVEHIPTFLADMDARHEKNSVKIQKGIDRLTAFIAKAESAGSDTAALETNLATLISYQADIEIDRNVLIAHLTSLESFACSADTLDAWATARATTKANFDALKDDVADVIALRAEIKANVRIVIDSMSK